MTVSCAPTASRSFGCNTEWKDGSLLKTGAYLHSCTLCTKKSSESQNSCTLNIACNVTNSLRRQVITSAVRTAASVARKSHLAVTYSFTLNISCDVTNLMSHQIITNSMRHQIIMSSTPAQYTLLHPRTNKASEYHKFNKLF